MQARTALLCAVVAWTIAARAAFTAPPDEKSQEPSREPAGSVAKDPARTWTDETGTRQVSASLLEVREGTAHFLKANGKRAVIGVEKLSAPDREYIAQFARRTANTQSPAPAAPPLPEFPVLRRLVDQLGPVDTNTTAASEPEVLPVNLVYVRLSRKFLEQQFERAVKRETPVDDYILGTSIRGRAQTRGTTDLVLEDNDSQAVMSVRFAGTIHSQSLGYNGPVVLHNQSQSTFQARKQLVLSQAGLRQSPTTATAQTASVTTDIETRVGGLRGRIAEKVAWRRAAESRAEADAIAGQHVAEQVKGSFDKEIRGVTARIESKLLGHGHKLIFDRVQAAPVIRFNSTRDAINMVLGRASADSSQVALEPPPIEGDPLIAVRAHRALVRRTLTSAEAHETIRPLLAGLVYKPPETAAREPAYDLRWSEDGNWLMIDYDKPSPTAPSLAAGTSAPAQPPERAAGPVFAETTADNR